MGLQRSRSCGEKGRQQWRLRTPTPPTAPATTRRSRGQGCWAAPEHLRAVQRSQPRTGVATADAASVANTSPPRGRDDVRGVRRGGRGGWQRGRSRTGTSRACRGWISPAVLGRAIGSDCALHGLRRRQPGLACSDRASLRARRQWHARRIQAWYSRRYVLGSVDVQGGHPNRQLRRRPPGTRQPPDRSEHRHPDARWGHGSDQLIGIRAQGAATPTFRHRARYPHRGDHTGRGV